MNIRTISNLFLYRLLNVLFVLFFSAGFAGYFYKRFADRDYYLFILIGLLVAFSLYYFFVLQHDNIEFVKKGKGTRILLGLLLLAHLTVQLTGGAVSILFPLYYLAVFLIVYRYSVRSAYYSITGIALLEYGSLFRHGAIEDNGILLLIKLIFLMLMVFVVDTMNNHIRARRRKLNNFPLNVPAAPTEPVRSTGDTIELLSSQHEKRSRSDIDQELFATLSSVIVLIRNIFQPFTCAIFHYHDQRREAAMYIYHSDSSHVVQNAHIREGEGLVGLVIREKKTVIMGDISQDSRTLVYYDADEGVRSFLALPLLMNGVMEGVLVLDSTFENAFGPDDQGALMNFSELITSFIHKSRLTFELRQSRNQVSGFYEISRLLNSHLFQEEVLTLLIEVVRKMFKHDRIVLCLAEDGKQPRLVVKRISGAGDDLETGYAFSPEDKGQAGRVFRHRAVSIISDVNGGDRPIPRYHANEDPDHGFASFMAVPLAIEHKTVGVLCIESRRAGEYSDEDKEKISTVMNIAEMALSRAHLYQRMENLATLDGLTGLANHRHFQNILAGEIRRARRHGLSMALLMVDIDYFKQINDNHGHQTGDVILKDIAGIFRETVREVDLVARYGGEEFAILLVGDKPVNADLTAQRIRQNVQEHRFNHGPDNLQVTISVGIARFPDDSENQSELIRLADRALYLAKESGRDCVKTCRDL